ncbi:hypothetical protein SDC9_00363 [bioreactor metagenome]|uniref:Phage tail collar domain-containing protein n=1 Tax=bioreactor metagenome TaxID=1076179 RepID=A0A644SKT1_9ZZZZ
MNRLDLDQSGGLPLSTQILDNMQSSYRTTNELGRLAGDKTIVSGCIEAGGVVTDGFVIINGELLKFKGSALSDFVVIQEVAENPRGFEDGSAKPIIYERYATFGTADVQYAWSSFKRPLNLLQIEAKLTQLENMVPIGLVAIWDRPADAIPAGWVEHLDLAGRTAVGHLDGDVNFGALGVDLGAAQVTLTLQQMPRHRHKTVSNTAPTSDGAGNFTNGSGAETNTTLYTDYEGGDQPHSNIQPSRIVKYIRFVGFN